MEFKSNVIVLDIGLRKQVRILQLTDVHVALADEKDGEEMIARAARQRRIFFEEAGYPERDPIGYLENAMEYSKDFDCMVITGDVLDFNSHANRETVKKILAGKDYMFCAGNHEFCPRPGIDSFDIKAAAFDDVQRVFRGNMVFESRIVGGVNVIAIDNSYYIWTEDQFEKLKFEVERGYPCLLFCHSPLTCGNMQHNPTHSILTVSEDIIEFTRTVTNYIINEPMIKAVFSGHYHNNYTEVLGEKKGYILGGLFKGIVGEIIID